MSEYLITGAAGFIAARVAEMLLEAGHQVVGIDNMNDAYDVSIKERRLERLRRESNFDFFQFDISDRGALRRMQMDLKQQGRGRFAAVINLAARAGVRQSVANPWVYVDTNITGTLNLLELCKEEAIKKFILASTSSVYGEDAPLPTPEGASSDLPLQPYAATKKGAEALCHAYHYLNGLDVSIFRYFTVYGPWGRPDMSMFRFTQWIFEGRPLRVFGDGEQSRGFTYVDDIARGTLLGLQPVGFEIMNLGGHESITINALIHLLEKYIGQKAQLQFEPRHPADMLANRANVEKAGKILGWEPQVPLQEGVRRLVEWYKAERDWASQVSTG